MEPMSNSRLRFLLRARRPDVGSRRGSASPPPPPPPLLSRSCIPVVMRLWPFVSLAATTLFLFVPAVVSRCVDRDGDGFALWAVVVVHGGRARANVSRARPRPAVAIGRAPRSTARPKDDSAAHISHSIFLCRIAARRGRAARCGFRPRSRHLARNRVGARPRRRPRRGFAALEKLERGPFADKGNCCAACARRLAFGAGRRLSAVCRAPQLPSVRRCSRARLPAPITRSLPPPPPPPRLGQVAQGRHGVPVGGGDGWLNGERAGVCGGRLAHARGEIPPFRPPRAIAVS